LVSLLPSSEKVERIDTPLCRQAGQDYYKDIVVLLSEK
jgi:hypothetical protein